MQNDKTPQENPQQPQQFQSDTDRIVHRHLKNKDDVITEEDIRNVRIGQAPSHREVENEHKDFSQEVEEADRTENGATQDPTENPITPWDTLDIQ